MPRSFILYAKAWASAAITNLPSDISWIYFRERYEREKAEDLAEYENYILTGKAIDNDTVASWLDELASGKKTVWPKQK